MTSVLVAVAFPARDPAVPAGFWAGLLGREIVPEPLGTLVPGDATQIGLRFIESVADRLERNRLHLHITSASLDDQQRTVETALSLGGRHLDVGQRPEEGHVVLADPEGIEFCVIEPGEGFLEGCGRLGEVTCDGSRDVGLFWRDALGWPLVWDEGLQTAIQSPDGGTKLSWDAWDGAVKVERNRQRFDLAAADPSAEAVRLVGLGATPLGERAGRVMLADPDGYEFQIAPA